MKITQPIDGSTVPIAPNTSFTVTGTNTTGDEVDGTLIDDTTGNAFAATQSTITNAPDAQGNYTWTLTFDVDNTIQNNDFLTVDAYDAITGGDDVEANYQESLPSLESKTTAPSPTIQVKLDAPIDMTEVEDIALKVTLKPTGTDGFLFLTLRKQTEDPDTSYTLVLHRYLPPSPITDQIVTFSKIDVEDWDVIRALGVVKGQKKPASVLLIKPKKTNRKKPKGK